MAKEEQDKKERVLSNVPEICRGCMNSKFFDNGKCFYHWHLKKECTMFMGPNEF